MEYSEDHIVLAAEYALGTLDAEERAQAETMMSVDPEFTAMVQAWEFRLGVLNQMVGSVEPPAELWERIRTAIGIAGEPQAPLILPEAPPIGPAAEPAAGYDDLFAPPPAPAAPPVDDSNVIRLSRRMRGYRNVAVAMTAIAAALLALIGVQVYSPGRLPGLSGKPATHVAEVKPTPAPSPTLAPSLAPTPAPTPSIAPSAQYVALLQGAAGGPAFILTIDGATRNFTVRKVGAPPIDAGKNYELWLISDKLQNRPRSLGVIGTSDFVARPLLAGYDADVVNNATYAVTVEQSGGSPDGVPHSQPVFIGKLIETVPAQPAQNR
jgi:anti-sigma-K factor RskA